MRCIQWESWQPSEAPQGKNVPFPADGTGSAMGLFKSVPVILLRGGQNGVVTGQGARQIRSGKWVLGGSNGH